VAADRDRGRPSGQRTPSHRPGAEWRGRARRWAWLAVLLIGVALYELCRRAVLATRDPLLLPTLILIGAAVVPVSFVVFVSGRRLVFGVGGAVVGLTALLGGVLAVLTAGTLEYATLRALGAPSLLAVGLIEELAKLLVPAAVLLLSRGVRHPADGLLLGVAAGAGFAVAETMGYAFVALVRSGGDLSVVNTVLVDRGVLSPPRTWRGPASPQRRCGGRPPSPGGGVPWPASSASTCWSRQCTRPGTPRATAGCAGSWRW
jgi:hypothetical protein